MSDAPVYDPVELRRRIVVCFTIGELRELADQLGVGGVAWERGTQEAAREVVRQCERYAGLPALVAKLRELRPLVEWPEAGPEGAPAAAAAFPAAPALAPPGGFAPAEPQSAIPDPFAAASSSPSSPTPPLPPPPVAPPRPVASPVWPAAVAAPPPPARGIDPRILVLVAGMMLLAAVIAYLAGRASNGGGTAPALAGSVQPATPAGPAALAQALLARSFDNLARTCELTPSPAGGELVFRRVFERCGPTPTPPRPRADPPPAPPAPPEPSAVDDDPPEPRTRPRRPAKGGDPAGEAPAQPSRGCTAACDAEHRSCKARCGPEPTESGGYQGYQLCLGRCLSEASHCRLSCR